MNDETTAVARKMSSLSAAAARHFATHRLSLGDDVELVVLLEQPDDDGSIVGAVVGASATHIYIQPDDEDEDERAVAWVRIKLVVIRQKHEARLDGAERMVILVDGAEAGRGAQGTLQYAFYADDPEQEHFVVKRMTGDPQILDHLAATALDFVQHKHRHLIQYMAVRRVTPNELWILMPVVPGVNLEQLLARRQYEVRPPFDEVTVCSIVYQLTDALHFMHNNYVPRIHQDVKLSNVMIAEGEVVTLIDVDVSRIVNTRPERPEGTFDHMAPEALDSRPTCASDIFGLGCILFALLTNPEDLMLSHPQHGDLTLNSSLWTPATLEAALRRATLRWDYSVKMIDTLVLMLAHDESKRPTADMLRITFSELTASLLGVAEE